jgi:hypothetical protein
VKLSQGPLRVNEVLQDVEAHDRVEWAVELVERLLDGGRHHPVVMLPRELGLLRHDLDPRQPRGAGSPQPRPHAAGSAAHVEHSFDRPRQRIDDVVSRAGVVTIPGHAARD